LSNEPSTGVEETEEDATFCLIKGGTFFPLFCLTNPAQLLGEPIFFAFFNKKEVPNAKELKRMCHILFAWYI
jgi:hypothetical protein